MAGAALEPPSCCQNPKQPHTAPMQVALQGSTATGQNHPFKLLSGIGMRIWAQANLVAMRTHHAALLAHTISRSFRSQSLHIQATVPHEAAA